MLRWLFNKKLHELYVPLGLFVGVASSSFIGVEQRPAVGRVIGVRVV